MSSAIIAVLLGRDPSAIGRLIIAVVIATINLMLWTRFEPHVLKKYFEGLPPAAADADPSPSIILPLLCSRIGTSALHRNPSTIFSAVPAVYSVTVKSGTLYCPFPSMASAASALLPPKSYAANRVVFPTLALTKPMDKALVIATKHLKDGELSECQSGQIFDLPGSFDRLVDNHRVLQSGFMARAGGALPAPRPPDHHTLLPSLTPEEIL